MFKHVLTSIWVIISIRDAVIRPSKNKKHMFLVRISIKKESGRAGFFLLFIISYCMLSLHIITFPQGYVGALRSNINKTKQQILINTSLFNFDTHKGLTVKIYIILVCTQQQWADKRHLSILSFLCMRQRRTKYKAKVTPVGFCS